MSTWFKGQIKINCTIEQISNDLEDIGQHFVSIVGRMPGMTSVELIKANKESVEIKTNEGLMTRDNIHINTTPNMLTLEFDEKYKAGKSVTATSHFKSEFTADNGSVSHRLVISDVQASGVTGFIYRTFAKSSIGKAFLKAYKTHLETG